MINVTKTYLPDIQDYIPYLNKIWKSGWVTNHGQMVQELEKRLKSRFDAKYLQIVSNGTVGLQIAIKALDLKGEIITTPFSYVATASAILWEKCIPVFVDIDDKTFCINADIIEKAITSKTSAILATHVFGFPCDVLKIEKIAKKHGIKIIYDGAHAFDVKIYNRSIFSFGDISILSFHATKIFHTVEGGAIISNSKALDKKIFLYKSFGHIGEKYYSMGINGKNSELHAAIGLCILKNITEFIEQRKAITKLYKSKLYQLPVFFPVIPQNVKYNYAYCPVIFRNEKELLNVRNILAENNINTRRYFSPSLNKLPYLTHHYVCPVSENISKRILCLPLYQQLTAKQIDFICSLIKKAFKG